MPRNVYEGYCNLIDHFPVGSTLSVAEVRQLVNCSEQTASRIVQAIPGKYVERTIQKKDRDGRKRRYITLLKPFTALDLKLWVIRHQSEEKIVRDTKKTKVAANPSSSIIPQKNESSTAHKDQTDLILQLQQELARLKARIEALEDYCRSPWYKKGFKRART
jgi:DNA-binding transcriptional regulator GbsR (MarR family)